MTLTTPLPTMLALSDQLESEALALPQVPCPVVHHFGPGVYMREVQLSAGTFVVGRNHRQPHMNVMLKGKLQLVDDAGVFHTLEAPQMFTSQGGRKCALVLEDTVWLNVLATDLVDVEAVEAWMFDDGPVASGHYAQTFEHHRSLRQPERDDFAAFVEASPWTVDEVRAMSEAVGACSPSGATSSTLWCAPRRLRGRGCFAPFPSTKALSWPWRVSATSARRRADS